MCLPEALVVEVGQQLRSHDVVAALERLRHRRGSPESLRCDNGSEFTSQLMDLWAYQHQVRIDYSRPGKPTDNAYVESFNGTFRDECLNAHWFESIADARAVVESWRVEDNDSRPHRALGEVPPAEFARRFRARPEPAGQPDADDSHRHWHRERGPLTTLGFTNSTLVAPKGQVNRNAVHPVTARTTANTDCWGIPRVCRSWSTNLPFQS